MDERSSDPEEALAEFLYLQETGAAPDFAALCAGFGGDVEELRRLHAEYEELAGLLGAGRPDSAGLDARTRLGATLAERATPFERYEVGEELARGGMGAVHRVWDKDLERHLAMKVVLSPAERDGPRDPAAASRTLGRFLEEARVTGQLDHPGVVAVHELGVDDQGRCYFTMKLVRGIDLREVLKRHAAGDAEWSTQRLVDVVLKATEAVAYAHSKGVIHRDLKPANIMVGRFGEVYVMDWGLARVQGRPDPRDVRLAVSAQVSDEVRGVRGDDSPVITLDGHVVGTPSYIAPEQAQGRVDELGPRADVYSLGATLYHLLAGTPPYVPRGEELGAQRVLLLALQGPPRPLRELAPRAPLELVAICERAMARDPLDRYAGAAELAADLRAFLEGRTVSAFRGGAWFELRKWAARNRALAATAAVAVLLAATLLGTELGRLAEENRNLAQAGEELRASERLSSAERDLRGAEAAELVRNLRAADEVLLDELARDARRLPPPGPAAREAHQDWLRSANSLYSRLPLHASLLADLARAGAEPWELRPLEELVRALEAFGDATTGAVAFVERRAALCDTLVEASLEGLEARAAWAGLAQRARATRATATSRRGSACCRSGPTRAAGWRSSPRSRPARPRRATRRARLVLAPASAVVLVLLPGGAATVGAQAADPRRRTTTRPPRPARRPCTVALAPRLVAKHELTRAQWARLVGAAPPAEDAALLPVADVSQAEAGAALASVGLALPGEAAWEDAARGGTDTPWWSGADAASLAGAAWLDAAGPTRVDAGARTPSACTRRSATSPSGAPTRRARTPRRPAAPRARRVCSAAAASRAARVRRAARTASPRPRRAAPPTAACAPRATGSRAPRRRFETSVGAVAASEARRGGPLELADLGQHGVERRVVELAVRAQRVGEPVGLRGGVGRAQRVGHAAGVHLDRRRARLLPELHGAAEHDARFALGQRAVALLALGAARRVELGVGQALLLAALVLGLVAQRRELGQLGQVRRHLLGEGPGLGRVGLLDLRELALRRAREVVPHVADPVRALDEDAQAQRVLGDRAAAGLALGAARARAFDDEGRQLGLGVAGGVGHRGVSGRESGRRA
ncbi:MAG: protein kinase [Planctomycetes bacterium]|nr:protein kinase [Planctomycetota bacterium]